MDLGDWEAIIDFWFDDLPRKRKLWFNSTPEFDGACREFEPLIHAAMRGELDSWCEQPQSCLALILVCDQLPRNAYRATAEAFASDQVACSAAREGVRRGFDLALERQYRSFFYMPFEHSEDIVDQHTAVGLFKAMLDTAPPETREIATGNLGYAEQHRDIILRFGRFPHRNAVLNRESTPEELEYLESSSGFGQ